MAILRLFSFAPHRVLWIAFSWMLVLSSWTPPLSTTSSTGIALAAAEVASASQQSTEIHIHVPTMHCGHCAHKIQKALNALDGVERATSSMYPKSEGRQGGYAHVILKKNDSNSANEVLSPKDLIQTISRTGFAMATVDEIIKGETTKDTGVENDNEATKEL